MGIEGNIGIYDLSTGGGGAGNVTTAVPPGLTAGIVPVADSATDIQDSNLIYDAATNLWIFNDQSTVEMQQLQGRGVAPTGAVTAFAGTGASIIITGTDLDGRIIINAGTAATGTTNEIASVTFNKPYGSAPKCVMITAADRITGIRTDTNGFFIPSINITNIGFQIWSNSGGVFSSTTYSYYYLVIA